MYSPPRGKSAQRPSLRYDLTAAIDTDTRKHKMIILYIVFRILGRGSYWWQVVWLRTIYSVT